MHLVVDGIIYQLQARGGISRTYSSLLPAMCEADASLRVELRTNPAFVQQPLPSHPRIRRADVPFLRPARVISKVAPGLLAQAQAGWPRRSIFHATYYGLPPAWRGPRVVSVYDLIYMRYASLWSSPEDDAFRTLQRRSLEAADAVISNSEATKQDVLERLSVDADRVHVVHLSHDPVFHPRPGAEADAGPFILYVGGRGRPYKGFGTLLEAYARWPAAADIGLTVVGGPWDAVEAAHIARLGLESRIRHLGSVGDDRLASLYATAAAFVYPSHFEGFGIPLLEAMACRCPLVAADIPTTHEVAGDIAYQCRVDDPDSLVAALDEALRPDPDRLDRGEARAGSFSWERAARETLDVYRLL